MGYARTKLEQADKENADLQAKLESAERACAEMRDAIQIAKDIIIYFGGENPERWLPVESAKEWAKVNLALHAVAGARCASPTEYEAVVKKGQYFLEDNQRLKGELERSDSKCNSLNKENEQLKLKLTPIPDAYVTTTDTCSHCSSKLRNAETSRLAWQGEAYKLSKENEQLKKACFELRECLVKWREYFQASIPTNADQQEEAGEQFTDAWFGTERALSRLSALVKEGE